MGWIIRGKTGQNKKHCYDCTGWYFISTRGYYYGSSSSDYCDKIGGRYCGKYINPHKYKACEAFEQRNPDTFRVGEN